MEVAQLVPANEQVWVCWMQCSMRREEQWQGQAALDSGDSIQLVTAHLRRWCLCLHAAVPLVHNDHISMLLQFSPPPSLTF